MKKLPFTALLVSLLILPGMANAFRCSTGKIVSKGDTKTDVQLACGLPYQSSYEGVIKVRGKFVYIERWVYKPESGGFYSILEFHDSTLKDIDRGPRVQ